MCRKNTMISRVYKNVPLDELCKKSLSVLSHTSHYFWTVFTSLRPMRSVSWVRRSAGGLVVVLIVQIFWLMILSFEKKRDGFGRMRITVGTRHEISVFSARSACQSCTDLMGVVVDHNFICPYSGDRIGRIDTIDKTLDECVLERCLTSSRKMLRLSFDVSHQKTISQLFVRVMDVTWSFMFCGYFWDACWLDRSTQSGSASDFHEVEHQKRDVEDSTFGEQIGLLLRLSFLLGWNFFLQCLSWLLFWGRRLLSRLLYRSSFFLWFYCLMFFDVSSRTLIRKTLCVFCRGFQVLRLIFWWFLLRLSEG